MKEATKPLHFTFTNKEIEALPEDLRDLLGLKVFYPPTQLELLTAWVKDLPFNTEFNSKDIVYFFWKDHQKLIRLPDTQKLAASLVKSKEISKTKTAGVVTYRRIVMVVPRSEPKLAKLSFPE